MWSEWEVNYWLDWCQAEFGLHGLGSDLRGVHGGELCGLDREAFLGLMSDCTAGEILWEHLEDMRRGACTGQPKFILPNSECVNAFTSHCHVDTPDSFLPLVTFHLPCLFP